MSMTSELRYLLTPKQALEIGKYLDDLTELQRYKKYRRLLIEQDVIEDQDPS